MLGFRASCRCAAPLWMLPAGEGRWRGGIATKTFWVTVQISEEGSQHFRGWWLLLPALTITCDGKSWSAADRTGLSRAPAVSVHLWPGGRGSSALPRVHESSIQLISPPFPSLPLSPEGGCTDIVCSTSSGSCYAWQEVQALRPPRAGRPRGRAFGRESRRSGEEKRG